MELDKEKWVDPIVEQVREERQRHAARFNYDPRLIFEDLRRLQESSGRVVVSFASDKELEDGAV